MRLCLLAIRIPLLSHGLRSMNFVKVEFVGLHLSLSLFLSQFLFGRTTISQTENNQSERQQIKLQNHARTQYDFPKRLLYIQHESPLANDISRFYFNILIRPHLSLSSDSKLVQSQNL